MHRQVLAFDLADAEALRAAALTGSIGKMGGNVGHWAHMGGFLVGLLCGATLALSALAVAELMGRAPEGAPVEAALAP